MDQPIRVSRLTKALCQRGSHRMLGGPFLGAVTAFLTLLLFVRIAANLYLTLDLSNKGLKIDAVQVASAHLIFVSAYLIWVGSLASVRMSFAVPRLCFIDFAPNGRRFKAHFVRRITLLRPVNVTSLSLLFLVALAFSYVHGDWYAVLVRTVVVLSLTFAGAALVIGFSFRVFRNRSDIQIMETLYLVLLVALNPDLGSFENKVSLFFGGIYYPFYSVWAIAVTITLMALTSLVILVLIRGLSAVGNLFRRRLSTRPMTSWYLRFLRIRSWALLYVTVIPILLSSFTTRGAKRWALASAVLFSLVSYVSFAAHCENTLNEKWQRSLLDKGKGRIMAWSLSTHIALAAIPALVFILSR